MVRAVQGPFQLEQLDTKWATFSSDLGGGSRVAKAK